MAHETKAETATILPLTIITEVDLGRISRELAGIEDFSLQSAVRDAGKQPQLPRTSRSLEDLARLHELNLLIEADRAELRRIIDDLRQHAPVLHMSFASDPSSNFLNKLVTWLRNEIDPSTLLRVGLQPGIAAGCIVRTRNKYFDFSLRKHLDEHSQMLIEALMENAP
ncbi:MAG: hypothetical protein ACXWLH_00675 [Candidatus Saccharimonadales bacterium]